MKSDHTLHAPDGHAASCSCRACMNIAWLRAAQAGNDPVMLPVAHAVECPCPICERTDADRRPLVERFRDAAQPGDFEALLVGTKLGVLLMAALAVANHAGAIVAWLEGLW